MGDDKERLLPRSPYEVQLTDFGSNPATTPADELARSQQQLQFSLPSTVGFYLVPESEAPDDWTLPGNHHREKLCKRTFGAIETLVIIAVIAYSFFILFHEDLYHERIEFFYFVLAVLLSDIAIICVACLILCLSWCTGGHHAVKATIGLFIQGCRSLACYILLGYGIYFMYMHSAELYTDDHWLLLGYIAAVTSVTGMYSIVSCATVCGALGFVGHKIWDKLKRRPLVEFQQSSSPSWFTYHFGVDRLQNHLREQHRPTRGDGQFYYRQRDVSEPMMFERGEEVGSLTETPMDQLLLKMGLDKEAPSDEVELNTMPGVN